MERAEEKPTAEAKEVSIFGSQLVVRLDGPGRAERGESTGRRCRKNKYQDYTHYIQTYTQIDPHTRTHSVTPLGYRWHTDAS